MNNSDSSMLSTLLTETVTVLCRNSVKFDVDLKIQGLLVLTADSNQVYVVEINDTFMPQSCDTNGVQAKSAQVVGRSVRSVPILPKSVHPSTRLSSPFVRSLKRKCLTPAGSHFRHRVHSAISSKISSGKKLSHGFKDCMNSSSVAADTGSFSGSEFNDAVVVLDSPDESSSELLEAKTENTGDSRCEDFKPAALSSDGGHSSHFTLPSDHDISSARATSKSNSSKSSHFGNKVFNGSSRGCDNLETFNAQVPVTTDTIFPWSDTTDGTLKQDIDEDFNSFVANISTEYNPLDPGIGGQPSDSSAEKYVCQYSNCGIAFSYKRSLYRHQRMKHGTRYGSIHQTAFFCFFEDCGRTFYSSSTLSRHLRDTHGVDIQNRAMS